jgi:hypothetical protein
LHDSDPTITYGETTTLSATLAGGSPNSYVVFERKGQDGDWHAVDVALAGSDLTAALKVGPSVLSRYRARFLATPNREGSLSGGVTVEVHAKMLSDMIGRHTRDGRYAVYRCCTSYLYVKVKPLKPGEKWTSTVQYFGNGKWRPLGKAPYKLERDGDAAIFLNAVTGYHYRVRGRWDRDAQNLAATSAWNYFKYK